MILVYGIDSGKGHIRLSKAAIVAVLVSGAIYANLWAVHRVGEIKQDMAMQEQLNRNLSDLMAATEAIAKSHQK